ncbi:MAG TPA: hypothetical protein VFD43_03245 [Planctomycetota bacterium]|nr:hypothetical protein [Planctomycetota bacterium]
MPVLDPKPSVRQAANSRSLDCFVFLPRSRATFAATTLREYAIWREGPAFRRG